MLNVDCFFLDAAMATLRLCCAPGGEPVGPHGGISRLAVKVHRSTADGEQHVDIAARNEVRCVVQHRLECAPSCQTLFACVGVALRQRHHEGDDTPTGTLSHRSSSNSAVAAPREQDRGVIWVVA